MLADKARHSPRPIRARAVILLAYCLACLGCGAGGAGGGGQAFTPPQGSRNVDGAPFYAEDSQQCGPASLAALMSFYGKPQDPGQVARAVYRPGLRGSLNLDLMLYARGQGLCAEWQSGRPQELVSSLDQGRPLLVLVDIGLGPLKKLHYMVVTGYSSRAVRVNSGLRQGLPIAWPDFLASWSRTKYAFLRMGPMEKGGCP